MKEELEKLVELQKTDTNIRKLKKAIETADERRAEIEQEFEQHASSIRDIQAIKRESRQNRTRQTGKTDCRYQNIFGTCRQKFKKRAKSKRIRNFAMREADALAKTNCRA